MTSTCEELPRHWRLFPSHRALLGAVETVAAPPAPAPAGTGPAGAVPLLVVPASRHDPHLRNGVSTAVGLAREGAVERLLFLCSKQAAGGSAVAALNARLSRELPAHVSAAVRLVGAPADGVPSFAVDRLAMTSAFRRFGRGNAACTRASNDIASKRNLGVLLAYRLGLGSVLFVDDDVRPQPRSGPGAGGSEPLDGTLDAAGLRAALHTVGRGAASAVGWVLRGYDDNSVLCRVSHLLGHEQEQFIGAGALLTRIGHQTPFFPAIYNEDWLFLLGWLRSGREPAREWRCGGSVLQDVYDGFQPRRARAEELGDVLGEGLMTALHEGANPLQGPPSRAFWRGILQGRKAMIDDLLEETRRRRAAAGGDTWEPVLRAVDAADVVHTRHVASRKAFWVDEFVRYVEAWIGDLRLWREHLLDTPVHEGNDVLLPGETTRFIGADAAEAFRVKGEGTPVACRLPGIAAIHP